MAEKLDGVKSARRDVKSLYKQSKSKGMKAASELGEMLMPEAELADYVKTSLSMMGIGAGFSIEDIAPIDKSSVMITPVNFKSFLKIL